jgi:hypothetical protein
MAWTVISLSRIIGSTAFLLSFSHSSNISFFMSLSPGENRDFPVVVNQANHFLLHCSIV